MALQDLYLTSLTVSVKTQQNEIKIVVYEFLATKYPRGKKMDDVVFAADRIKGTKADMSMKEVINYACINYSPVSGRYKLA